MFVTLESPLILEGMAVTSHKKVLFYIIKRLTVTEGAVAQSHTGAGLQQISSSFSLLPG